MTPYLAAGIPVVIGALITGWFALKAAERQRQTSAVNTIRDADNDEEALAAAAQNGNSKTAVVFAVLDRQLRANVDCEVKLAQEKKERKADVKRLEARLEELSRGKQ